MWTLDDGKLVHIVIEKVRKRIIFFEKRLLIPFFVRLIKWNGGVELLNLIQKSTHEKFNQKILKFVSMTQR